MHQGRTRLRRRSGQVGRTHRIDGERGRFITLGRVDGGVGRRIDDDIDTGDGSLALRRGGDVEVGPTCGNHVMATLTEDRHQVATEHAARTGHEDASGGGPRHGASTCWVCA